MKVSYLSLKNCSYRSITNFKEVGSLDLTCWPDLRWPGVNIFRKVAERMADMVCKKRRRGAPLSFRYFRKTAMECLTLPNPPAGRGFLVWSQGHERALLHTCLLLPGHYWISEAFFSGRHFSRHGIRNMEVTWRKTYMFCEGVETRRSWQFLSAICYVTQQHAALGRLIIFLAHTLVVL